MENGIYEAHDKIKDVINDFSSQINTIENKFAEINVKYPPIPLVGAKGDGVTDDYEAIQNIVDYCFNNDIYNIYFPEGNYNISRPLILKCKRESSQVGWWDGKGICINGANKATTKIVKTTNNVLSNIHTEVDGVDSTFILFNGNSLGQQGGAGTGISITNMYIQNNSTSVDSMAITGKACTRFVIEQCNIKSYSGIMFDHSYSSKFSGLVFYCNEKSLHLTNGTSNLFEQLYSINVKNPRI